MFSLRKITVLFFAMIVSIVVAEPVSVPNDYVPPFYPEGKPLDGLVITVDPGHGGSSFSSGYHGSARGVDSRVVEGDLNMRVAATLFYHLRHAGAEVHLTRRDDRKVTLGATGRSVELGARPALAEATRSHLFLSLHHNATGRETAHGVVILIWPTDKAGNDQPLERSFADYLEEEIKAMVPFSDDFSHYVLDHPLSADSDLPSAVVEFGFLTNKDFDNWIANNPTSHKTEAIATYNAVVRMWKEHRSELEALRNEVLGPDSKTAKTADSNALFVLGAPSASVWGIDRPAENVRELQFAATAWRASTITDRTTQFLETSVTGDAESGFAVEGWTMHPFLAEGLVRQLSRAAATDVSNKTQMVPAMENSVEPFGVVSIPMASSWGKPGEGRDPQTQLLHGEPLFLLNQNESGDYYQHMGIDGYVGWVRKDAVRLLSRDEFTRLMTEPSGRVKQNVMNDDFRVPPASRVLVTNVSGEETTIELGDGTEITVPATDLLTHGEQLPGREVAKLALEEYLYSPYVFGGRSPLGIDCSGLVGACWAAVGVQLPRDAHQQALVGQIVATPWYLDALQPGDVLFFIDNNGRVIHTGLSLGGMNFIHASPPEVQINSLDPKSPLYSETWAKAFIHARRPMP